MPVSAYVIRCRPADQAAVRRQLDTLPGLQIGEATALGLPVAVHSPSTRAAEELGEQLQRLPGVRSATLVYHNFEDVAAEPAAHDPLRL